MPQTLTGVAGAYVNTITAPVDGEAATMTTLVTLLQQLLNNEASINALFAAGVKVVRTVSNDNALRNLVGMVNGECAIVLNRGLYVYVDPDATAAVVPWVRQPNVGTGRWFHILYAIQSANSGLATLDAVDGRLAKTQTRGQYVASYFQASYFTTPGPQAIAPGTEADVADVTMTVPGVVAGDTLVATAAIGGQSCQGGGDGYVRIRGVAPSSATTDGAKAYLPSGNVDSPHLTPGTAFVTGETGAYVIKARAGSDLAATYTRAAAPGSGWSIRVDQYRNV